jgi:hypothetical protein
VRELDLPENTVSQGRAIKFQADGVVTGITASSETHFPATNHPAVQIVKNGRDALFSTGRERIRVPVFAICSSSVQLATLQPPMLPVWIPVRRGEVWRTECETAEKDDPPDQLGYDLAVRVEEWIAAPEPPNTITETQIYAAKVVCPLEQIATEQIEFVSDAVVTGILLSKLPWGNEAHPQVQVLRAGVSPFACVLEDTVAPCWFDWPGAGAHEFPVLEPVSKHEQWKITVSNGGAEEKTVWAVFRAEEQRREPW